MERDPQTAAELHALVSQWPEEARPLMLYFQRERWRLSDHDYHDDTPTLVEIAIDLHVANGLRYLLDHPNTDAMSIIPAADKSAHYRIELDLFRDPNSRNRNDRCTKTCDGPTLFLALHAAIIAAKESA